MEPGIGSTFGMYKELLAAVAKVSRYNRRVPIKPNNPKFLIPIAILIVVIVFVGNFLTGGAPYSANLADLKTQFNQDRGKVRLLMLLAPS